MLRCLQIELSNPEFNNLKILKKDFNILKIRLQLYKINNNYRYLWLNMVKKRVLIMKRMLKTNAPSSRKFYKIDFNIKP